METKQTAVDWMEEQIRLKMMGLSTIENIFQQAKAMEKEQIKDAFTDGCIGELYELNAYYTSEKYYNNTYGPQVDKK
jgi:hypothetical protein